MSYSHIIDGTGNTILRVETVDAGITWLEPRDLSYEDMKNGEAKELYFVMWVVDPEVFLRAEDIVEKK